jgi:hypothetical protein
MGWRDPPPNIPAIISTASWVRALDKIRNFPPVNGDFPTLATNTIFEAFKCLFYFTVQQIEASVTNGIYSERVINEYSQVERGRDEKVPLIGPLTYESGLDVVFHPPFAKDISNNTFIVPSNSYGIIGSEVTQMLYGNISVDSTGFTGPPTSCFCSG